MNRLYYSAVLYTLLGLAAGLYYRELTKAQDFVGDSQLSVVHTHLLALGMLFFLVVLALERYSTCPAAAGSHRSSGPATPAWCSP